MNEPLPLTNALRESEATATRRLRVSVLVGVYCIGFLLVDVVTPQCFQGTFPAALCINVVTAQLTAICVWGTLVHGTFWVRLPWTLLLLVVSWCALVWGNFLHVGIRDADDMIALGCVLLFGFVASFVPLKVAAVCFRWRITQISNLDDETRSGYAIRDMMVGTLLLAISMAIARGMLPDGRINVSQSLKKAYLDDAGIWIAMSVFGVASLLVKLPCIWIAFAAKAEAIVQFVLLWSIYCFFMTIGEMAMLSALVGDVDFDLVMAMVFGHQVMGIIMLAVFLPLRGLGYRLERSIKRPAQVVAE